MNLLQPRWKSFSLFIGSLSRSFSLSFWPNPILHFQWWSAREASKQVAKNLQISVRNWHRSPVMKSNTPSTALTHLTAPLVHRKVHSLSESFQGFFLSNVLALCLYTSAKHVFWGLICTKRKCQSLSLGSDSNNSITQSSMSAFPPQFPNEVSSIH